MNDPADAGGGDFASFFERSISKSNRLAPGQMVETHIVSISGDTVFLELSGKSEGILDRAELADQDGRLAVKEGDKITVFFQDAKNGEMRFTTKISGDKAGQAVLENAFRNGIPVEGTVEKEIKGGYEVRLGESRAFCPYSHMGPKRADDPAACVGKRLGFKILEHKEGGRSILVSNRAIIEEERQKKIEALKGTLVEGAVVKGTIKSIQSFGAFVDIEGIQALLPVSEIALSRVEDIHKAVSVGQEIEAMILKADWKNERISLSLKRLLADPWETAREKYPPESKHKGRVVRIADFGAFVALEPGIDGLIHVSEMKGDDRYGNARIAVKMGETLTVEIKEVDVEARRISLRPASSFEEDESAKKYLESSADTDTYNPFAKLLKK
jgi:small subunit ribosomal protein S1